MVNISIPVSDTALAEEYPSWYLAQLRQTLERCFDEGELRTFCSDLRVNYDSLAGGTGIANKARELVNYLARRGRIPELVRLGKQQRPHASWEHIPPEQLLAKIKHAHEPPEGTPSARAEKLSLKEVQDTVRSLHDKWPTAELAAVDDWLRTIKEQLDQSDQMSSRLITRLAKWVDRYQKASKIAQDCIYFQSWLSVKSPKEERENWQALAQEIYCFFSPIRSDYGSHATDIQDTKVLTSKEGEILDALGSFGDKIDRIEKSRSLLLEAQEDEIYRQAFSQIQNSATKMAECSINLCQCLHSAIKELVNEMGNPIQILKKL